MPQSLRDPIVPRPTIQIQRSISDFRFSDELIGQLTDIWQSDLERLRFDLVLLKRQLRPWYVRLWDWWHGQ